MIKCVSRMLRPSELGDYARAEVVCVGVWEAGLIKSVSHHANVEGGVVSDKWSGNVVDQIGPELSEGWCVSYIRFSYSVDGYVERVKA